MNGHQETKTQLQDLLNKRFTVPDNNCKYYPPTPAERKKNMQRVQYNLNFYQAYAVRPRKQTPKQ